MRRLHLTAAALAALSLSLAGCGGDDDDEALMEPGSNCLACHTGGEADRFTFAGTVYGAGDAAAGAGLAGATVTLAGTADSVTLVTNAAGNFFTGRNLGTSVDVTVSFGGVTVTRQGHLSGDAGCATCHDPGFRVHVGPNRGTSAACAACHGPT